MMTDKLLQTRSQRVDGLIFLLSLITCGCSPQSQIQTYYAPIGEHSMTTEPLQAVFGRTPPLPPVAQSKVSAGTPVFQPPANWRKSENDQFSLIAFSAGPEDRAARVTVTRMSAGMELESQLNRWRGQLSLPSVSSDKWSQQAEILEIGGVEATFVYLKGASESIAGAVLQLDGSMWFFKMRGPNDTVAEELARMKEFCQEARFDVAPQWVSEAGK